MPEEHLTFDRFHLPTWMFFRLLQLKNAVQPSPNPYSYFVLSSYLQLIRKDIPKVSQLFRSWQRDILSDADWDEGV